MTIRQTISRLQRILDGEESSRPTIVCIVPATAGRQVSYRDGQLVLPADHRYWTTHDESDIEPCWRPARETKLVLGIDLTRI